MHELTPLIANAASEGVEVRIRSDEYESNEAIYLCHVPLTQLDNLIAVIRGWGVAIDGNTYADASGQFVIGKFGAFFEVIVAVSEDD